MKGLSIRQRIVIYGYSIQPKGIQHRCWSMKLFIYGVTLVVIILGCKKDKTEFLCNCDQLEGRFLTTFYSHFYDSWSSDSRYSDVVIATKVEGNSLIAHGITFEISSDDQTVFENADAVSGAVTTLTYSNNYQSIVLEIDSGLSGPGQTTITRTYTGNSTTLLASSPPGSNSNVHPYKSEIEGEYLMWYTKKAQATSNESDTMYQDTFIVTMNSETSINISGTSMGFGQFHSYYREYNNNSFSSVNDSKGIRWGDDSLFISKRQVITYLGMNDTSSVSYVGIKL